jgi:ribosome-associated translation inhibitor RaiA
MTISFQYVKFEESTALSAATRDQLDRLSTKFPWLIRAQVYFKIDNTSEQENSICEIELSAPGPRLFASSKEVHFETAMKETISDLDRQLSKRDQAYKVD